MYHILKIHSCIDEYLAFFQFLDITNETAMSMVKQMSL